MTENATETVATETIDWTVDALATRFDSADPESVESVVIDSEHLRGVTTPEGLLTFMGAARRAVDVGDKRTGEATIKASRVTFHALRLGVIADGRGSHKVSKGDYAKMLHRTNSTVSKWINLGHGLEVLGIDPEGDYATEDGERYPLWDVLANKGGDSKVSDLLKKSATADEREARIAEIVGVLSLTWDKDSKRIGAGGTARVTVTDTDEAVKAADEAVAKAVETNPGKTLLAMIKSLTATVEKHRENVTSEDMAAIREALNGALAACGPDPALTRGRRPARKSA